jgi:hypothetical protein
LIYKNQWAKLIIYRFRFGGGKEITYFYLTKVSGEIQEPNFIPDELEQGYKVEWYLIDEAIKILEKENEYEEYIK